MPYHRLCDVLCWGALWILLCGFQTPSPSTDHGLQRWNWALQHRQTDTLLYYHASLIEQWEQTNATANIKAQNRRLLAHVMAQPTLNAATQRRLLEQYPPELEWAYAYRVQWHWQQQETDSAYFYLSLLEARPNASATLVHTYAHLAQSFAQQANLRDANTYLKRAESRLRNAEDALILYPCQVTVYTALGQRDLALQAAQSHIRALAQQTVLDSVALAYAYDRLTQYHLVQEEYQAATRSGGMALNYMADRMGHDFALSQFWFRLATAYFQLKNRPLETLLYLRRVLELLQLNPPTPERQRALVEAYCLAAGQFAAVSQRDSAEYYIQLTQTLQEEWPHRVADVYALQAMLAQQTGRSQAAGQALLKALEATRSQQGDKGEAMAARHLALAEHHLAQRQYALAHQASLRGLWALSYQPFRAQTLPEQRTLVALPLAATLGEMRMTALLEQYRQSRYALSKTTVSQQQAYNEQLMEQWAQQAAWNSTWAKAMRKVCEQAVAWHWEGRRNGGKTLSVEAAFKRTEQARWVQFLSDLQGNQPLLLEQDSSLWANLDLQEYRLGFYQRLLWRAKQQGAADQQDWYQQQFSAATAQRTLLLQTLEERHPRYKQWYYNQETAPSLEQLQTQLRQDQAALLHYLETPTALYQWVCTADTLLLRRIQWEEYAPMLLKYGRHFTNPRLRQNARSGGFQDYCRTAREVYYRLVHHEQIKGVRRWVVVPDGLLQMLPFETLLTDIPLDNIHEANYSDLAYLLRQHRLSYHYSQCLWWNSQRDTTQATNHDVLALAATYMGTLPASGPYTSWRPLVPTQTHSLALLDSFNVHYAGDFYPNRYATEHYLKTYAGQYGIVHWGCYGMAPVGASEGAGILLAPDNHREDHLLWMGELRQLTLNADLLVVGNWWTDRPARSARQHWSQLGGSALYAHARALLLPIWTQDSSSTLVVDAYYKNLALGMEKDEALRQAKLTYLQNAQGIAAHPARWAGYLSLGSYQSIKVAAPVEYIWWFVLPIAFVGFLGWWSLRALRQRR